MLSNAVLRAASSQASDEWAQSKDVRVARVSACCDISMRVRRPIHITEREGMSDEVCL
jgi:hypothetical protein